MFQTRSFGAKPHSALPSGAWGESEQRPLPPYLTLTPIDRLVAVPQVDQAEPVQPDGQVADDDLGFVGQSVKVRPLGQVVALVRSADW
jgi:hypothetical protein